MRLAPCSLPRPIKGRVTWLGHQGHWRRPLGSLSHPAPQGGPHRYSRKTAVVAVGEGKRLSPLARDTRFPKVSLRPIDRHLLRVSGLPSRCALPTMQLRSLRSWRTPGDSPLPPPGRVIRSTSNPEGAGAAAVAPAEPPGGRGQVLGGAQPPCSGGQHLRAGRASARTALRGCSVSTSQPGSPRCPTAWEREARRCGNQRHVTHTAPPHAAQLGGRAGRQGGMMV